MLIEAVPGTALAFLVLMLPGLVWAWWCYPSPDAATRLSVGFGSGLALQMLLLILLGSGPGITRASIILSTLALTMVAGLLVWRTHLPRRGGGAEWRPYAVPLALALGALLIPRIIPLFIDDVPQGWDPSFHSLLAGVTVATGRLPTWAPYEPIPLNYPYGSHLLIAALALITGLAPDSAFAALLAVLVPLVTGLAIYALARRLLRRRDMAVGAVVAYGLLGNWGSLDYTRWGGLPNALGFALLLIFLLILFAPGFGAYRIVAGGVVLGSIPLAHNHVALTAGLMLAAYGGFLALTGFGPARVRSRSQSLLARRAFGRLALCGVVALATAGFYIVPLASRAGQLRNTTVLRLIETVNGLAFAYNGWVLWGAALLGACLLYIPMSGYLPVRRVGRGGAGLARAFVIIALVTLAAAFCLGYYGYRSYSLHIHHQPYTAFTPSRFLTDMTYFLAIYAGVALAALWRDGRAPLVKVAMIMGVRPVVTLARKQAIVPWETLLRATLVVLVAVTAAVTIWPQVFVGNRTLPGMLAPGELQTFTWIRRHSPKRSLVINLDPNAPWAPYFTEREVAFTPVPTDEFTHGYVDEKRFLVNVLLGIYQGPEDRVLAAFFTDSALESLLGRPVFMLTSQVMASLHSPPAYRSGTEYVYRLPSGFSPLLPSSAASSDAPRIQWWTNAGQAPPPAWFGQPVTSADWPVGESASAVTSGARYARITLNGPTPPLLSIVCQAESGAQVFVDGRIVPGGCSGGWMHLPEVSHLASHVIALEIVAGPEPKPWGDLVLLAG